MFKLLRMSKRKAETEEDTENKRIKEADPMLKIVSFNVAGLTACVKKDFCANMQKLNADIICLQEIKTSLKKPPPSEIATTLKAWKYKEYNNAEKPGYSGTGKFFFLTKKSLLFWPVAILSKHKPLRFTRGMGKAKHDKNGRVTAAEFEKFWLVTTYVPNSGQKLVNLEYRTEEWEVDFRKYLSKLGETKVIVK